MDTVIPYIITGIGCLLGVAAFAGIFIIFKHHEKK
jgi:hypothetical protein